MTLLVNPKDNQPDKTPFYRARQSQFDLSREKVGFKVKQHRLKTNLVSKQVFMHKGNSQIVRYSLLREEAVNLVIQLSNQSSSTE